MRPLLLLGALACKDAQVIDDTGLSLAPRERRSGEQSVEDADALVRGIIGDGAGSAAAGGRGWALAVGAPERQSQLGVVGVFEALPPGPALIGDADLTLGGAEEGGLFGASLVGYGETGLAVGARWDPRGGGYAGSVSLYADPLADAAPAAVWLGSSADYAGHAMVALAGSGGAPTLAVGLYGANVDSADDGVVALIPTDTTGEQRFFSAETRILGRHLEGSLGAALSAGDVDGDGVEDLCVGARGEPGQGERAGAAYVLPGSVSGVVYAEDIGDAARGEVEEGAFGAALSCGADADGDGRDDLLVGAPGRDGGVAFLFTRGLSGGRDAQSAEARLTAEGADDLAGAALSLVSDQDGDGVGELLIGAPQARGERGAAYLLHGPVSGAVSLADADWRVLGATEGGWTGGEIGEGGDLDGDGYSELLIGAPGEPADGAEGAGLLSVWR